MFRATLITAIAISIAACYTPPATELAPNIAGNYVLDPTHTSVIWSLSHAGLSNYTARFDSVEGTLAFSPEIPENSIVDIKIDPRSVSTGLPDFDETIKTDGRYFNVNAFPSIRYVSTSIDVTGENTGIITGKLTFRGITKPVALDVIFNGAGSSFGNPGETLGFSAKGTLKRSDFGLDYLTNFGIGDEVTLRIETEFNEKQ